MSPRTARPAATLIGALLCSLAFTGAATATPTSAAAVPSPSAAGTAVAGSPARATTAAQLQRQATSAADRPGVAAAGQAPSPSPSPSPSGTDARLRKDCSQPGQHRADFPNGYDAATRTDAAFNAAFVHCFTWVDGVRMHYVSGGKGQQTLLLLHGWPQSWYSWHKVMPQLAERYRLIVADLPGLGDSQGSPPDYRKKTLARYLHRLTFDKLHIDRVGLVTHDLGAGVGYQYAAQYRAGTTGWITMDFPLVGKQITAESLRSLSYHFALHYEPGRLAEKIVDSRRDVRQYLTHFYPHVSAQFPNPISPAEINEFVRTYQRRPVLHGGFELYRTLFQDQKDNIAAQQQPLTIPVTLIAQAGALSFELPATRAAAPKARGVESTVGHWIPDNDPRIVLREVRRAFPQP